MKPQILFLVFVLFVTRSYSQQYSKITNGNHTLIQVFNNYYVETQYAQSPAGFISTKGGFIQEKNGAKQVVLEFNSNYATDSLTTIPFPELSQFKVALKHNQDLDGHWLMSGRVRNGKTSLRDTTGPRKTLKILFNGNFQWIAFNTETFNFFGTGGGTYTAENNTYTEHILFFSRDATRVGASLEFKYALIDGAWHHKGLSSKGKPIYEIWKQRPIAKAAL